jgi:adenine deaminase
VLRDVPTCEIAEVFKSGQRTQDLNPLSLKDQAGRFENSVHITLPETQDLRGPEGLVHTIGVWEGKIITEHRIRRSQDPGIAHLSVLERYGHGFPPSNGYVEGFGLELNGAIASSVGHDSHNLIAVGSNPEDMRVAFGCLANLGGGFCVVQKGTVLAQLALPIGGLMSHQPASVITTSLRHLKAASLQIGCVLQEPFLQLAFLSLPVIPSLKLTDRGLVDVENFQFINVQA